MRIVAWHPLLTDHQAYTYAAAVPLVEQLCVNVWRTSDVIRSAQGWQRHSPVAGEERTIPAQGWWRWSRDQLMREADAWHLFGSPFEDRRQIAVLLLAAAMGRKIGIVSEPYSISSAGYFTARATRIDLIKQQLRPMIYKAYGALLGKRLGIVFAISALACRQYARMGVAPDRIAPFGYFVPGPDQERNAASASPPPLGIAFVGSLIERKGIDTAVAAVRRLREQGRTVTLDLYGPGDAAGWLGEEGVAYRGTIPFGNVASTLAGYDALVLPSRFDGWGVIGNEAIQAGVPIIVSDAAGVSDVVRAHGCGHLFRAGDDVDLARCLEGWLDDPAQFRQAAASARATAPLLEPAVAAEYMINSLRASTAGLPLPFCPWYSASI